jgi:HEAT repeat protein
MLREFTEPVQRLAHDPDPVVRGLAVGALWQLPGATTERLLRAAINDPDDRVVANAVEGMDRLDVADRVALTEPKLGSPSSRVRANAVKSLLRAELRQAGEVLLDMLADPSAAHRLSALWVVERIRSRAALGRVRGMSIADPDQRVKERASRICSHVACGLTPGTQSSEARGPVHQVPSKGGAGR